MNHMKQDQKFATVCFALSLLFVTGIYLILMHYENEFLLRMVLLFICLFCDAVLCITYFIMYKHLN